MTFLPNKYQRLVYTFIQKGKGNAVIDAVAGSGKSTTIVNALKLIPKNKKVLFLAFNKAIVEELKIKVGNLPNVEIRTLHSLGASAVMRQTGAKLSDDKYKAWVNNGIKYGSLAPRFSNLSDEQLSDWKHNILHLIDLGRVNLVDNIKDLESLAYKHNLDLIDNEATLALAGIDWGKREIDHIDFTDMIYFPNVKQIRMPQYDWVFIDECQDLNAAQREMFLKCIKPGGRFIAVGDPRQAIYGFAGADVESFNILKNLPHTAKLPLSLCYRCDTDIVDLAKEIVPQLEARVGAGKGVVTREALMKDVQDGDLILCRVSAPLVNLCMKYIGSGIKAYVKGRDIGTNLINMIKKTNRKQMSDVIECLQRELSRIIGKVVSKQHCTEKEAKGSEMYRVYEDKINAIEILSEGLSTAAEVISRIDSIFKDGEKNGICLSTIHKSKGLESDRVFIICEDKMYLKHCMSIPWMAEQETNLVYVAYTRAKHYLGFIQDFAL